VVRKLDASSNGELILVNQPSESVASTNMSPVLVTTTATARAQAAMSSD
jgi:hypothetical protein